MKILSITNYYVPGSYHKKRNTYDPIYKDRDCEEPAKIDYRVDNLKDLKGI